VFVILASYALHEIYEDSKYRIVLANRMGQQKKEWKQQEKEALQRIVEAQEYARQQREDSMSGYFDMGKALRDGNIQMSVSAAYGDDKKPEENNDGKNREEDGEEKKQEENGEVSSHETDTTE
jgi:cobalamin biosynthesis protein CobT